MAFSSVPFVGRGAELAALDECLARRKYAAIEIVGEPGIGKTRLLAELEARADRQGCLVLAGSASELEADLPFGVFVDALDEYLHALEPRRLDQLAPELGHVFPSLPRHDGHQERYRLHRAVRELLEALAVPKPLVLILDDLHWADSGSLELLGALLRRPPAAPVLLALAIRPRQIPERLAGALERADDLTRIELGSLSAAEARELVGDGADALYADCGGNPFYLQQLARAPRQSSAGPAVELGGVEVPRAVAASLASELALLSGDARKTLEGAAVAGDPFEPELAAAAAGLDEAHAIDAIDALLASDLIRPTDVPRRFRFRHPLVRRAVYERRRRGLADRRARAQRAGARGARRVGGRARTPRRTLRPPRRRRGDRGAARRGRGGRGARAGVRRPPVRRRAAAGRPGRAGTGRVAGRDGRVPHGRRRVERRVRRDAWRRSTGSRAEAHGMRVRLNAICAALEHLLGRHSEARARLNATLRALPDETGPEAVAADGDHGARRVLRDGLRGDACAGRSRARDGTGARRPRPDRHRRSPP